MMAMPVFSPKIELLPFRTARCAANGALRRLADLLAD
jgi:hypothetical protein